MAPARPAPRSEHCHLATGITPAMAAPKSCNVLPRLYGPLQPWFDTTWKPGDFELVK